MNNLPMPISVMPSQQEINTMKELGNTLVKSGFLPTSIRSAEQAIAIMLKGREVGIPPMQAFSDIAVINGKPAMSASLMVSLGYKNIPGLIVNYLTTNNDVCEIEVKRPGGKLTTFKFSMEDAKRAGLAGKGPWATYPAAMLRARCTSAAARAVFPDALNGINYTPEELGAEVDEDGMVLTGAPEATVASIIAEGSLRAVDFESEEYKSRTKAKATEREAKKIPEFFKDESDPGEHVCTFGRKYKDMKLKDIGEHELENYSTWLRENSTKNGGSIHPTTQIFLDNAEAYLKTREFQREAR